MTQLTSRVEDFEQRVAGYLLEHPEFFHHHESLLLTLEIPHPSGPATSLVERQLQVLRDRNRQLELRLEELRDVGHENDKLADRMLQLAVALIRGGSLETLLESIRKTLREEFQAEATVLRIGAKPSDPELARSEDFVDPADPGLELFADLFAVGHPKVGRLQAAQNGYLFGDHAERMVCAALIPMSGASWRGLLAVGSERTDRFHPDLGTFFLGRMGRLISHALDPFLNQTGGAVDS